MLSADTTIRRATSFGPVQGQGLRGPKPEVAGVQLCQTLPAGNDYTDFIVQRHVSDKLTLRP
jgi:hypothetical protein